MVAAQKQRDDVQKKLAGALRTHAAAADEAAASLAKFSGRTDELEFEVEALRKLEQQKGSELLEALAARGALPKKIGAVRKDAEKHLEEAEKRNSKQVQRIEELEFEVENVQKEVEKKTRELSDVQEEAEVRMKAAARDFEFEESALRAAVAKKSQEVDELLGQRASLQREMTDIENERLRLDAGVRDLDKELMTLRDQIAAAATAAHRSTSNGEEPTDPHSVGDA